MSAAKIPEKVSLFSFKPFSHFQAFAGVVSFQFPCGAQLQAGCKLLISRSEVWAAHFSSEATFCDQETVKVEDASFEAFQKLLQWVHGTCPQLTSLAVVFDLMYLAEKYQRSSVPSSEED